MDSKRIKNSIHFVLPKVLLWGLIVILFAVTLAACIAYFCTDNAQNKTIGTVFGVFAGITVVSLLAIGTMCIYFAVRKKFAYSKYSVEVSMIAIVFLACVLIKLITGIVLYETGYKEFGSETSVSEGLMIVFSSFYEGVSKLTFQGITALGHTVASIIYYGASVYAGMMFLGIISAKASYEGYSYMRMCFKCNKNKNVYVFTALTDETLELAKSIVKDDELNKRNKNAVIVFAGSALDPFDRHEDLCREVMANGFLYWSYSDKKKTIAKVLHLNNKNYGSYDKDFVVFAFEANGHIPEEENNMSVVFSDIEKRIEQGDDGLRIVYYILTKRGINYQAYESKKEVLRKKFNQSNSEFSKRFVIDVWNEANTVARRAVDEILDAGLRNVIKGSENGVSVWSLGFGGTGEAVAKTLFVQTAGIDKNGYSRKYSVDVFDKLIGDSKSSIDGIFRFTHPDFIFVDSDKKIEQEYINLAKANVDNVLKTEDDFDALVKDCLYSPDDKYEIKLKCAAKYRNLIELIFAKNLGNELNNIVGQAIEDSLSGVPVRIEDAWAVDVLNEQKKLTDKLPDNLEVISSIIKEFILSLAELIYPHPVFKLNSYNCLSKEFYDKVTEATKSEKKAPDVIVIATGDDYQNVCIANALMQNAVNNTIAAIHNKVDGDNNNDNRPQYIVVNIFNKQNNDLLNSFDCDWADNKLVVGNVTLIVVGNYEDTYSIKGLIRLKREASWQNYTYEKSLDCFKDEEKLFISNYLYVGDNSDEASKARFVKDIRQFAKAAKELICAGKQSQPDDQTAAKIKESLEMFDAIDLWKKESNKSVVAFRDTYKNYLKPDKDKPATDDQLVDYALTVFAVEHDRWTRLHVSDGWVYKPKSVKKKHHHCIADTRHIDDKGSFVYDFMNAVWAVAESIENK